YFYRFFFTLPATTEIYTLPYTTLFRSRRWRPSGCPNPARPRAESGPRRSASTPHRACRQSSPIQAAAVAREWAASWQRIGNLPRSEEHTSELQSRRDLVCRLLLEKKKK